MDQVNNVTRDTPSPAIRRQTGDPRVRSAGDNVGAQYLTFVCDGQEYGVEILRVQEIKGWDRVTRVPHSPDFVLGVMNLRGTIVPVVDLRRRFGLSAGSFDASTVVIVVHAGSASAQGTVGIMVDAVSEVYNFDPDSVRPPPEFGAATDRAFVSGIATIDDKMVMLLDIDKLVGSAAATTGEAA
jgi:purine-binding chemotaxis protein CheW